MSFHDPHYINKLLRQGKLTRIYLSWRVSFRVSQNLNS